MTSKIRPVSVDALTIQVKWDCDEIILLLIWSHNKQLAFASRIFQNLVGCLQKICHWFFIRIQLK